jgi:hypothetical protein
MDRKDQTMLGLDGPGRLDGVAHGVGEMTLRARTMRRLQYLGLALGIVILMLIARDLIGRLPHEPRLYLVNQSGETFDHKTIHSACGDIELPPLGEGESIRLSLAPRAGCEYAINDDRLRGEELLRLMELARKEKVDVEIGVGIDYVSTDLAKRHHWW